MLVLFNQSKLPKLPCFDERHDCIDAYLQRFERFAESSKWVRESWYINISALQEVIS